MMLGFGFFFFFSIYLNFVYMEKKVIKYMEYFGQEVCCFDIVVDIFCVGICFVWIFILQFLVNVLGGLLVLYDDFGEVFFINL